MVLEDLDEAGYPLRKRSCHMGRNSCLFGMVGTISRKLPGENSRWTLGSGNLLAFGDQTSGISKYWMIKVEERQLLSLMKN